MGQEALIEDIRTGLGGAVESAVGFLRRSGDRRSGRIAVRAGPWPRSARRPSTTPSSST
ncbi:MAG: hypothetical protein M0C28_04475 [Candidatus Moduliflexus flocculans]|nr:hypothetical protein [Candidatus Moduliflexus flocculans]